MRLKLLAIIIADRFQPETVGDMVEGFQPI